MKRRNPIQIILTIAAATCASTWFASEASAGNAVAGKASEGLVFAVPDDDGMDLWRARLADGALRQITATPHQEERRPIWSEAAQRLIYIARNTDGFMKANVKLFDVTTGEEKELGPEPDLVQLAHVWSPDGKFVAHTFRFPATQRVFITRSGTVVVDIEKATRVVIAKIEQTQHNMMHLEYSSDGLLILAHGRDPTGATAEKLWLLPIHGRPRQLRTIPRGIYEKPHFTRDNTKVVFSHQLNRSRGRNVMTLELAPNARAMRLASQPNSDDHSAVPSPVRDEVVFVSDRDGSPDLFRVDLAGGTPVNLTKNSKDADLSPIWSPDGERIAYIVEPAGKQQTEEKDYTSTKIRVIDRTGKILFETAGIMPSWMPPWTGDAPVTAHAEDTAKAKAKANDEP